MANLSAEPKLGYRLRLPGEGSWRALLDTNDSRYAGTGTPAHNQPIVDEVNLAPLSALWLVPDAQAPLTAVSV